MTDSDLVGTHTKVIGTLTDEYMLKTCSYSQNELSMSLLEGIDASVEKRTHE